MEKLEQEEFDMALVDATFAKCKYLVPHRPQIPWITYTVAADPRLVRVPWLQSFVPGVLSQFSDRMSFVERLTNTADSFAVFFLLERYFPDPPHEVLAKFRRYGHFSSLDELASKSVLWLTLTGDVMDYPRPMMPNMVHVWLTDCQAFLGRTSRRYEELH